jgi:hypothetical protein
MKKELNYEAQVNYWVVLHRAQRKSTYTTVTDLVREKSKKERDSDLALFILAGEMLMVLFGKHPNQVVTELVGDDTEAKNAFINTQACIKAITEKLLA